MKYEGKKAQEISFPVGGIGTGCIGIAGNGMLVDWEIRNRPNKCSYNGFSFFAVKAEKDGEVKDVRVLSGDLPAPYTGTPRTEEFINGYGFGPQRSTLAGVPHFTKCVFDGSYPFARLTFEDPKFPGKAGLEAFNPFIPSNEDDSGIPAAFFTVNITNDTDEDLDYFIAGSLHNMAIKGCNRAVKKDGLTIIRMDQVDVSEDDPSFGNLCIATDAADCAAQEYWLRGIWFEGLNMFWQEFSRPGHVTNRTYKDAKIANFTGDGEVGTITARLHIKSGESGACRFLISWSYPNFVNYWNPLPEEEKAEGLKNLWKNYYAERFTDSEESTVYAFRNWERLEEDTRRFHNALVSTTIPEYALDAVMSTMSVLKTPTCLRLQDGSFYGWEGCATTSGMCEGTCTHVWNYAYALPFLFPHLERTIRETNYRYNQDEFGGMRFRLQLPLGRKYSLFRPCADGQFGDVMKVYREWKICGDNAWLCSLWPAVKRSMEFAWDGGNRDLWDPNRDGVLEGRQHHTLDTELFGPSGWLESFYLGALKAASEMADAMDDGEYAVKYSKIYENGRKWVEENLYNGEYYVQKVDLKDRGMLNEYGEDAGLYWNDEIQEIKYQIGEGCSIDQVTGQWHASLIGLGDILDKEHVRSALEAIYRNNFMCMREHFNPCRFYSVNDEWGTVMCTWPKGTYQPVIPIPYAGEVMTGFEYQAAVSMMLCGMTDKGLKLVRSVRDRYDGEKRNPWNEIECGNNYARSMASYSILIALSGFSFDMTKGYIGFAPRISPENFKTFWSLDGVWGTYEQTEGIAKLTVLYGGIELKNILAGGLHPAKVLMNVESVDFEMADDEIVLKEALILKRDDVVVLQ